MCRKKYHINMLRFLSSRTVRPLSHNESTRRIELTPWDLFLLQHTYTQRGLLFLKPTVLPPETQLKNDVCDHLEFSLSRTLDIFYPLAGRLAMVENEDNTTSFFVDCNNLGAQFVHAVADGVTVADIIKPIYVPDIVDSFFLMNDTLNCEGSSKPLLSVQVTELVDGFFIGCSLNHVVADGSSVLQFFNAWSGISRGSTDLTTLQAYPIFERNLLDGIINFPIHIPNPRVENAGIVLSPVPLKQRVFQFTKEKIAELKAKANGEMRTDKISSLQAFLSCIWRSVTRSRCLDADQEVKCFIPIGTRKRMKPLLPEQYFGNALQAGNVRSTARELKEQGHGWAAWRINNMVDSKTPEEVRKSLENWVKIPRLGNFSTDSRSSILITGGSPRFYFYNIDFGWGKPVAVRTRKMSDGISLIFSGKEEGSIELHACFLPETLDALAKDVEFMEAVVTA